MDDLEKYVLRRRFLAGLMAGAAARALSPAAIKQLQQTIHSKVTGFMIDKAADYQTIKLALTEAGY